MRMPLTAEVTALSSKGLISLVSATEEGGFLLLGGQIMSVFPCTRSHQVCSVGSNRVGFNKNKKKSNNPTAVSWVMSSEQTSDEIFFFSSLSLDAVTPLWICRLELPNGLSKVSF